MNESSFSMNDTFDNFTFNETKIEEKKQKNQILKEAQKQIKNLNKKEIGKHNLKVSINCSIKEKYSPVATARDIGDKKKNKIKYDADCNLYTGPKKKKMHKEYQKDPLKVTQEKDNLLDINLHSKKYRSRKVERMFQWQVDCLYNKKILNELRNLIYSAPTSAGKTLVAEILGLKTIFERNKKVIFILPFVSIVREKMYYFQDLLESSGFRADGFMGSYNPPGGINSVHMAICTIEKANSLVNRFLEENRISEIGAIIVDEMHLLGDPSRGYLLELLLTKLIYISARDKSVQIQIVGMSATLPNLSDLAKWLEADLFTTIFRPVPLSEQAIVCGDVYDNNMKLIRKLETIPDLGTDTDNILQLCLETIETSSSVLIFCPSKNWCESLAQQLSLALYRISNQNNKYGDILRKEISGSPILEVLEQLKYCPVGLDQILYKVISFGVAFHHAGLTLDERDIIENAFRSGVVRILLATSTLSSGVNLPARRVIIRSPNFCGKPIDSLTYRQMIGRAGRMGKDTIGESFLVCQKNDYQTALELMSGNIPPVESCLEGSGKLKRAILEVISSGVASTLTDVQLFTNCTLLSITRSKGNNLENPIEEAVNFLVTNEFIKLYKTADGQEKYMATSLGKACLSSSIAPDEGLSLFTELEKARRCFVLESELHIIYLVTPYSACNSWTQIDWMFYLDLWDKLIPAMKKVGELVGVKESYIVSCTRGKIETNTSRAFHQLMVHKRFFVALVLQDLVNEKPLNEVCNKYNCNRGMLQSLQQSAATFAGMVTSFSRQLGWSSIELLVSQFQDRMQFGVSRDLLDLMRLHYLNGKIARILYNAGIETLVDLANSDIETIENIFHKAAPFESTKKREEETNHESEKRKKLRNVWIAGKEGLTEKEAGELLLQGARDYLQKEIGLKEAKWKTDDKNSKNNIHTLINTTKEQLSTKSDNIKKTNIENNEITSENNYISEKIPNTYNDSKSSKAINSMSTTEDIDENISLSFSSLDLEKSNQNPIETNETFIDKSHCDNQLEPNSQNVSKNVNISNTNINISCFTNNIDSINATKENIFGETMYKETILTTQAVVENISKSIKISKSQDIDINISEDIAGLDEQINMSLSSLNLDESFNIIQENIKQPKDNLNEKTISVKNINENDKTDLGMKITENTNTTDSICLDSIMANYNECMNMSLSPFKLDVSNKEISSSQSKDNISESNNKIEVDLKVSQELFHNVDSSNNFSDINFTSIEKNLDIEDTEAKKIDEEKLEMTYIKHCSVANLSLSIQDLADNIDKSAGGKVQEADYSNILELRSPKINPKIFLSSENKPERVKYNLSFRLSDESTHETEPMTKAEEIDGDNHSISSSDSSLFDGTPTKKSVILEMLNTPYVSNIPKTSLNCNISNNKTSEFSLANIVSIDLKALEQFLENLQKQRILSFSLVCSKSPVVKKIIGADIMDLHNNSERPKNNGIKMIGIGIYWGNKSIYYLPMDEKNLSRKILKAFKIIFENKDVTIRMFNSKEQIKLLKTCFKMPFLCKIEDPKITDWLLDPEGREKSLSTMVELYTNEFVYTLQLFENSKILGTIFCDIRNLGLAKNRTAVEAFLIWNLAILLKTKLDKCVCSGGIQIHSSFPTIYELEMRTVLCLANLEISGMTASKAALQDLVDVLRKHQSTIEKKAYSLAGRRFNFSSSADVAKAIGIYKGKRVSTRKVILEQHEHPISELVLQWRKINFTQTNMIIPLIRSCENNRIFGTYNSHTATGRLTMHEPNIQMVTKDFTIVNPITNEVSIISCRSAFVAPEGCLLISADYCQLELRILTYLSEDKLLLDIMKKPGDVFKYIAAQWNQVSEETVNDETRAHAKQICYGIIYGMGAKTLADQLGVSEDDAFYFMETFRNTYEGIKQFTKRTIDDCKRKGYVETITGRRRYLPNINNNDSSMRCQAERQAVNTSIQGSAADIVKHAMVVIEDKLNILFKKSRHKPILTLHLHDELIYEVPEKYVVKVISIVKEGMESSAQTFGHFPIKIKTGKSWGEMKEYTSL
ncbi:DNA polymerase theta isoform X2 [Rhynchophorus ferrugineus]|uniref:DNA polymerase theta isoform X2 n=1 Tax=Rhynchophorus ferrugineus TaxID=354439 RepID=UPI003FCE375C